MHGLGRLGRLFAFALAFFPLVSTAATIQLRAWLNGAQVPLAVSGTGLGTVTFDTVTKQLAWSVSYQGLSGSCTLVHFHGPAAAGVDAGIAVTMTCSASPLTGSATLTATQEAQLLSGQWYINIHTGAHPNGEIRGQVVRVRGDFNGDGNADVLWRNEGAGGTGEDYLYPLNGTQIVAGEGYLRQVADLDWRVAGIGDFDGDGKADILWRNATTGQNYVYLMDGTTIVGEGFIRSVADQNWRIAGVADFDGDGKDDILWRNDATGENYLYPMDGLAIKPAEGYVRTVANLDWRIVGVGDFDGNGKADVLWRNASTGENYVYLMDGTVIAGEGYLRTVADQNWRIAGIGDFDGDGRSDIFWRNSVTGENYLYPMSGTQILAGEGYVRTVTGVAWEIKGTRDYDGDGRADVLWRHASSGENYLYPMNGTAIKPGEGYLRTVPQLNWRIQNPPLPVADGPVCTPTPDVPDPAFQDTNCDGIDGDASKSFFVAITGDDTNPGTMAAPFRTIQRGIAAAAAAADKKFVLVSAGNYQQSLRLASGVSIYGAYNAAAGWSRSAANVTRVIGQENTLAGDLQAIAVYGASLSQAMVISDLEIVAPDATGRDAAGRGRGTYGVLLKNAASVLSIERTKMVAGSAFSGAAGTTGTNAPSLTPAATGNPGGNADELTAACNITTRGGSGAAGTNSAPGSTNPNGGAGGRGGTIDTDCSGLFGACGNCTATAGENGANAAVTGASSAGFGGSGGAGATFCGPGTSGFAGRVIDGVRGTGGTVRGALAGDYWHGNDGAAGALGENGSGGGGGGGSGGCDTGTDSYGAGGGGGGAGGARAQAAGGGGRGAGGSFGIYLVNSSPAIKNVMITRGQGATGGTGGTGGQGQPGGLGAAGGLASGDSQAGGRGGDGARGGHAGGGGGGAGGVSVAIFMFGGSAPSLQQVTYPGGGFGGNGGQGGVSPGNDGTIGAFGSLETTMTCASAGAC